METPSPPATQSAASAQLSEQIPDPNKFKATHADLRRFCDIVTEKLSLNRDRYPTPISRIGYVNSRLNDDAYKLIQPDFFSFHAEFQSLALEGGIEGDALAPFLEKAVSKELSEMLLHNPPADYSYHTLISHFRGLDIRLQEHRERIRPYISRKPTTTAYVRPVQTTRQERKSPSPRRGRSPPERAQPSGDPMDLSNQRRYQRPSYRQENNQYFRYSSSTHYIRDCPKPDTRPAKFRHAAITYSLRHPSRQESPKSPISSRSNSHNSQIYQENGASLS
ncbi:hypothetical protein ACKAV7_011799 [Fusarium commune]